MLNTVRATKRRQDTLETFKAGGEKMEINYMLYGEDIEKNKAKIEKGEPVEIDIMDQRDKVWQRGKVLILRSSETGTYPATLLGPQGEPYEEGNFYLKIMEMLPSDSED